MKHFMVVCVTILVVLLSVGKATITFAAELIGPSAPGSSGGGDVGGADETLQGEVLKIDGDKYVVRDVSGNNVSFRINERTKMEVTPQVGDKIEAIVTEGGEANQVKKGKKE
jgi:uncharacterized protein YdeI (BOF family)